MHLLLTSENLMKSFLREERFRLDIGANINGKNAEIHSSVQRPRTTEGCISIQFYFYFYNLHKNARSNSY